MELKPWILLNNEGNRVNIPATTAGNQDEIRDSQGRRLIEPNESERNLVFQIFAGVAPSRMQIVPLFGRDQNLGLEASISAGDDELWLTGFDSPYNDPSMQSELFYVNDMERLKLQAYNPMNEAAQARLSFHINKIRYATVTDVNLMKAMLQNQVPSKKYMMGLGAQDRHQLQTPEWLDDTFGENILTTQEILTQGDTTQAPSSGIGLSIGDAARLENA